MLGSHELRGVDGSKPNVVVILTDDQGWGDLSLHGNKNLQTPNIDSLARDGASFDRFYVCPVCSPTRAEFLTGRYHPRCGVYSTSAGGERLDLDERTIGDSFKAAGYATGAFGKWHNGMQYPYHPNGRGFDDFYGFCSGHWGHYFSPALEHNGRIVKGDGFVVDDFTDKAMAFMERSKKSGIPFFAYLPFNTPHSPMQVPDRWWRKFANANLSMNHREPGKEQIGHTRAALAMCENIDWNVGRLLKKIEELELSQGTIVVFFHDNGPNGSRWNGGMKGRKGSTDEGGVRSPLLVRWPGKIANARVVKQSAAAIDLLPTIADLAGIKVTSEKPLDGVSLKPLLFGSPGDSFSDRILFSHWRGRVSGRRGNLLLDDRGKLYDLSNDPGQKMDVADSRPADAKAMRDAVKQWRAEVLPELKEAKNRPFIIGHPDYPFTQIPARDARVTGEIKRSNRFPNCSYFTNWTKTSETILWPVEVGATGEYDVEIHYACPAADLGSIVELSFGDHKLSGKITEAHDPPLKGGGEDRVKRTESYVKEFRTMKMGRVTLEKGSGLLKLQATDIPGSQVMDFRLIFLTRVEK